MGWMILLATAVFSGGFMAGYMACRKRFYIDREAVRWAGEIIRAQGAERHPLPAAPVDWRPALAAVSLAESAEDDEARAYSDAMARHRAGHGVWGVD